MHLPGKYQSPKFKIHFPSSSFGSLFIEPAADHKWCHRLNAIVKPPLRIVRCVTTSLGQQQQPRKSKWPQSLLLLLNILPQAPTKQPPHSHLFSSPNQHGTAHRFIYLFIQDPQIENLPERGTVWLEPDCWWHGGGTRDNKTERTSAARLKRNDSKGLAASTTSSSSSPLTVNAPLRS